MRRGRKTFRYEHLATEIEDKIKNGTYKPGERLPSIRSLCRHLKLSVSTVYRAYMELETMGLVEVKPKSGCYVSAATLDKLQVPRFPKKLLPPKEVRLGNMINSVVAAIGNPDLLPLGSTTIDAQLLPFKGFSRIIKELSRKEIESIMSYSLSEGTPGLRRQIALRTVGLIEAVATEDIIITNGCTEAVALSLLATARAGDTIAVETPTNFSFLQLLQELGLRVVEVPTDPRSGVDMSEFAKLIRHSTIKACILMPNFHNPLGAIMPDGKKREVVALLAGHDIPLIEDDVSSELYFEGQRPRPIKSFDRKEMVLLCSSFSKTLAPGLRIGWIIPGQRFKSKIQRLKAGINVSTSTLDQYLLVQFLERGGYERQLRLIRKHLKKQVVQTALAIQQHFPEETRLAVPRGGSLLWVQLASRVDGMKVYQAALDRKIAVIPGEVCSNSRHFKNYIQISCGYPDMPAVETGIARLGAIIRELS